MTRRRRESLRAKPLDPFRGATRKHVALVAFLAWISLGADGLSAACYGPEEAFLALGVHTPLSLYLAAMTAVTVFVIALAYNQVIELFPSGGGGYKVATRLLGDHAGLVSGSALVVDYVLTIAISVASGVDALFSLLPPSIGAMKLGLDVALTIGLLYLNLRGMKESIRFLLPIFIGFVVTHIFLIAYGMLAHGDRLPSMIGETINESHRLGQDLGWVAVAAVLCVPIRSAGVRIRDRGRIEQRQSLVEPRAHANGRCSTWRCRWRSPRAGSSCCTCSGTRITSRSHAQRGAFDQSDRVVRGLWGRGDESTCADNRARAGSRIAIGGGQHGLPGWSGGTRQHGRRFMDAASVS